MMNSAILVQILLMIFLIYYLAVYIFRKTMLRSAKNLIKNQTDSRECVCEREKGNESVCVRESVCVCVRERPDRE